MLSRSAPLPPSTMLAWTWPPLKLALSASLTSALGSTGTADSCSVQVA